jgi:protein-disulfide isomerase
MKRMKHTTWMIAALALALGMGELGCKGKRKDDAAAQSDAGTLVKVDDVDDSMNSLVEGERYRIEYDEEDMALGPATAAVTIVEYSDFQCPYCSKLTNNLHELHKEFPEDVRIVFKHFPLMSIHKQAMLASQAALAANAQGKGWELHDKMFENQRALTQEDIVKYAEEIGVPDMEKFKKDLESEAFKKAVEDDLAAGQKFAVRSTPSFFVNGKPMRGAKPVDALKKLVEEEKAAMQKLLDKGSKPEELYARVLKAAKTERTAPKGEDQQKQRPGQPEPDKNYAVPTGEDRPFAGKQDALVTIVEFSDFQCPYCSRVNPTVAELKKKYPDDVRVIFRHHPLPMHKQAPAAARAAQAAHLQGKFWEMHDALFENGRALDDANEKIMELAQGLGLDMDKFKKDFDSEATKKVLKEDEEAAMQWGARGTPAFFVNGRFLSGAQPIEAFDKLVVEEKAKAEKFMKEKGVKAEDLYAEISKTWEKELKVPPPAPPADHQRRDVDVKGLVGRGNTKNPKITIVECSDFDCPYCKRGASTVEEVLKEYGDKVALYYRHNPLPMHKMAEPAHRASIAAGKQGKFWEMHDLLFENNKARAEADFQGFAEKLGLDMDQFKKDWADEGTAKTVQDDMKLCQSYGVRGVPGFLINGRLMSGAQPMPRFKEVLDEELAGGFEATAKKGEKKDGKAPEKDAKKVAKDDKKAG